MEEGGDLESDVEREEDEQNEINNPLRDRFRLSTISIAESQAKRNNMEISQPIMVCVADMAFKYAAHAIVSNFNPPEGPIFDISLCIGGPCGYRCSDCKVKQLAKDLELFSQHANRKSVNTKDVILAAHRNEHLATQLRCFSNNVKGKEPQTEKGPRKGDKVAPSVLHVDT